MANVKTFVTLAIVLFIVSMSEAFGDQAAKFIIHEVKDATPNDDWCTDRKMFVRNKQYTNAEMKVVKSIPVETTVRTLITFNGMDMPEHEMVLCDAFEDKIFGSDLEECLFPKPGFPTKCPIEPMDFLVGVKDYKFPQYKLPPNTPPGPVVVNVTFVYEDQILLKIDTIGEIVQGFLE